MLAHQLLFAVVNGFTLDETAELGPDMLEPILCHSTLLPPPDGHHAHRTTHAQEFTVMTSPLAGRSEP